MRGKLTIVPQAAAQLEEGWSRNMLLKFIDTDIYERRMAYASVSDLEIWRTRAPKLTRTQPLPILQKRLQNLRMKVIVELCVKKMNICFGNSATNGCTMPRFTAGYVGSGTTRAENAQVRTKIINQ